MKTMWPCASAGGRVTATVSMALGRAGSVTPSSRQRRGAQAPAATTTAPASMAPAAVSTPVTRRPDRRTAVTAVHGRTAAPSSRARRANPSTTSTGLA